MTLTDQNYKMDRPDVISSATSIRLPGVPGPVSWLVRIDLDHPSLKVLEIGMPNGTVDIIAFDKVKGAEVSRRIDDKIITPGLAETRQILLNAQIIAGLHLQLAIENVFGHA